MARSDNMARRDIMVRPDRPDRKTAGAPVLIMDDNADFVDFVREVVEICGHSPSTVTEPSAFKDRCIALKPRAVILDIHMPDFDGMHLTQWLGEFAHSSKLEMRLIIVSGRSEDTIQLCKSVAAMSGFEDVHAFNKPIEIATLSKALSDL